jgi:ABC-type transport system involved in multi-copper enzyme maturation permease subunit
MFASFIIENEPLQWSTAPRAIAAWVQDVGVVATVALTVCAIVFLIRWAQRAPGVPRATPINLLVAALYVGALVCYVAFGLLVLALGVEPTGYYAVQETALTAAGALAVAAAAVIPVLAVVRLVSGRRVWAIARLSIKEATRGRALWVFAILAVVFLFAGYFIPYRPEDQIRNYVALVFWAMTPLFLLMAALLGSFSIPQDVTRQTIHTVVTKPVERYEIVLGRFLGYAVLLTAGLFVLSSASLLYLWRGVTRQAAEESYKARVPVIPTELTFHGTTDPRKGESVGREWDYRSYIRGRPPQAANLPKQFAVFAFGTLPADLGEGGAKVRFEYTFDIYRTTKQEKGKEGIICTMTFAAGHLSVAEIERRVDQAARARTRLKREPVRGGPEDPEAALQQTDEKLAREHGVYEASGVPVVDYRTKYVEVPAAILQAIVKDQGESAAEEGSPEGQVPALKVLVSVGEDRASANQMLGLARRDLYVLAGQHPFWLNFFKGIAGLWFTVLLVLGLAVACSTYLSGVISLLCTGFLFGAGVFRDYVLTIASGQAMGGGPTAAATRLFLNIPLGAPLEQTPTRALGEGIDQMYSWLLSFVLKLVPDVQRFDLTTYVANGFDIPLGQVLFLDNFLPLVGYVVPWLVLAYYLINWREVANPS